jgi:hypothetical protein
MEVYMKKRLLNYLEKMDILMAAEGIPESDAYALEDLLTQIRFFQHERLIHLLVTLLFGLLFVVVALYFAAFPSLFLFVLDFCILVLLCPYIKHYYTLENGTQRLYTYYDRLWTRMKIKKACDDSVSKKP